MNYIVVNQNLDFGKMDEALKRAVYPDRGSYPEKGSYPDEGSYPEKGSYPDKGSWGKP